MPELPRAQLIGSLVVGIVVVALGALWVRDGARDPDPAPAAVGGGALRVSGGPDAGAGGSGAILVHVAGAVRRPGVYRLPADARVTAALRRAGGATRRADLDALNLAAKLTDGRQVLVPARAGPAGGAAGEDGAASVANGPAAPVNLNSATAEELAGLDGVGPALAARILAYRREHGGFGSVDELDQVPGIGPQRMAALRDHVTA